ncbi:lysine--tRNA ligase [Candidatus Pacearchaeota archaeon CG10_big_fil_rev_8_21_14_0_10_32_14]|nr:MAG: lysine--tRNA ligase [Candidatus Pacearchaeota archaeon CG10_big_fil_rev_8_21_14_0_10_32_14]
MGREEEIIKERIKKIDELRKNNVDPYPTKFDGRQNISEIKKFSEGKEVKTAGRVVALRDLGKIAFVKLRDYTGDIQIVFQDKETPDKTFEFFKSYVDSGDFVGVEGKTFKTRTGEFSILVNKIEILSKSILPLPEKWHGLTDEEDRYRKRYLDFVLNPEIKDLFYKKFIFWKSVREFLLSKDFIEVETPVLENTTGGADARPFITHHNNLDIDVFLRISMGELWQKRLMVAGFEKTFEIGRQFRNEGSSPEHLQDYTQMEFYMAYANYEKGMEVVEELYKYVVKKVLGTSKFKTRGHEVDVDKKWERIDYASEIKKRTGVDIWNASEIEIEKKLKELRVDYDPIDKPRLIDSLWKYCRKNIAGPVFVINQPVEISPLAKKSSKDARVVERFFVLIAGSELGNGYSELNDALDQEERFKKQAEMREKGDEEAQMNDEEFVEALKYGMPPTCGFGMSERVFAFIVDKPIRECVMFPLLRPLKNQKVENKEHKTKSEKKVESKKIDTKNKVKKEKKNNDKKTKKK